MDAHEPLARTIEHLGGGVAALPASGVWVTGNKSPRRCIESFAMTGYRILADLIVLLHAAWVGVVVFGMLAILVGVVAGWRWVRNFYFRAVHLLMIAVVVVQSLLGTACPLTVWENQLQAKAGQATYPGSFIGHWTHELIFFHAPEWVFTTAYCLFALSVVATFVLAPPRWPGSRARTP